MNPKSNNGQWLILAAAVLWGTTGTAQAFAPASAQPASIGAARLAVGGVTLLLFAVARGVLRNGKPWPLLPTLVSAASVAAYQLCFFAGVAKTGVATGTLIAIGSAPVLTGGLGFLLRGEIPDRYWLLATALAITGGGLLVSAGNSLNLDPTGALLALGAGAAYAIYAVVSKGLLANHHPDAVAMVIFGLGAVFLLPLLLQTDLGWMAQPRGLIVILHLGVFSTAAAYALFSRGLMTTPAAAAVTLSLAEPLTAGLLGVFLLGERLSLQAIVGATLLLGGLLLLVAPKPARPTTARHR